MKRIVAAAALLVAASCGGGSTPAPQTPAPAAPEAEILVIGVDEVAERFVKLALGVGQHDADYVDGYSGPAEWADAVKSSKPTIVDLEHEADALLEALSVLARDGAYPREAGLANAVTAAKTRLRMATGERLPFDEEARLLYGAAPPVYSLAEFDAALAEIDALLPGEGTLVARVNAFKANFVIKPEKLQSVMDAAITECRRRTRAHYDLPEGEKFKMGFVTGKPWSGYNWYQGGYESVIEINTDLPTQIDRAVDLGCHEGYPGHHVWNLVVDRDLRQGEGWIEFSILPLFSPQAMLGEGSANYGIELAFPGDEKLVFERDTLYPLAGLDPSMAAKYSALNLLRRKLSHVRSHVARDYLDGRMDRTAAIAMTEKYELESPARAAQIVDFMDRYRAYVINYSLGRDLVAAHIAARAAAGEDPWNAFEALLRTPDAAGALAAH